MFKAADVGLPDSEHPWISGNEAIFPKQNILFLTLSGWNWPPEVSVYLGPKSGLRSDATTNNRASLK